MAEIDRESLAKKLDADLDDYLETVYEKNKDFKYKDGLTEENLEEQIRKIPAFSNTVPTQADIDASPALQALQALKYETEDPHECAISHKEDGNYHFQKKDYKNAIKGYSEGLKQKHDDASLTAILYTNRAAANFYLGNYRTALNDSTWALKFKPDHMKAIIRGSICCFDMEKYDDCIEWCEKGFKIEPNEKKLLDMKKKSLHQKKQQERDKRKKEMKEIKNLTQQKNLVDTIMSRKINIERSSGTSCKSEIERLLMDHGSPHSGKIYIDGTKRLHWPVYLLYPEFNQSDFIEDFDEDIRFKDQLDLVFQSPPTWDSAKAYTLDQIEVFFEDTEHSLLIRVPLEISLKQALSDKRFTLRGGCPAFMIMSRATKYYEETFEVQKPEQF